MAGVPAAETNLPPLDPRQAEVHQHIRRYWRTDAALRPQPRREGPDNWPTPSCLAAALIRDVLPELPAGPLWECAAGNGEWAVSFRKVGPIDSQLV